MKFRWLHLGDISSFNRILFEMHTTGGCEVVVSGDLDERHRLKESLGFGS
jgi:hypothetical protein